MRKLSKWQKLVLFVIVLGLAGFGVWKLGSRPVAAPAVASASDAAGAAAPASPQGSPATAAPVLKPKENVAPVAADRREQVLADTKKLAALDVQVESLTMKALDIYNVNYGKDKAKGAADLGAVLQEATAVQGKLAAAVGGSLAPEVKPYADALTPAVAAKVSMISKWVDAVQGDTGALHEASNLGVEATKDSAAADDQLATLAGGLKVTIEALTGK